MSDEVFLIAAYGVIVLVGLLGLVALVVAAVMLGAAWR